MEVFNIPVNLIRVGERLREINYDQVSALAESIRETGLLHPITVVRGKVRISDWIPPEPGYWIVAGAHRLLAFQRLGLAEIPARVVELSELERDIVEIDENLAGTVLTLAERAKFTHRRKEIYEALHPDAKAGGFNGNQHVGGPRNVYGDQPAFVQAEASRRAVSRSSVEKDASRGARIDPDVLDAVSGTKLGTGNSLDALARMPADRQREVGRLVGIGHVQEALSLMAGALAELRKFKRAVRALNRAWKESDEGERRDFLEKNRGELERMLGVHPKLRSKPKLRIVDEGEGA